MVSSTLVIALYHRQLMPSTIALDTLASILAPRAPPAVPLHHRRRLGFDGEALVENEIAWALRNPDVRADPSLSSLDDADAYADLERMGVSPLLFSQGVLVCF